MTCTFCRLCTGNQTVYCNMSLLGLIWQTPTSGNKRKLLFSIIKEIVLVLCFSHSVTNTKVLSDARFTPGQDTKPATHYQEASRQAGQVSKYKYKYKYKIQIQYKFKYKIQDTMLGNTFSAGKQGKFQNNPVRTGNA